MLFIPRRPVFNPGPRLGPTRSLLGQGLVSYYNMGEGGGTKLTDVTNRNTATYNGSNRGRTVGALGPAIKLDGSSNYVSVPPILDNNFDSTVHLQSFSFSCWLYWTGSTESYNAIYDTSTGGVSHSFLIKSDGTLAFYTSAGNFDPISADTVPQNKWVFIGLSFDASGNLRVYINTKRIVAGNVTTFVILDAGLTWKVGGNSTFGSGRWLQGQLGSFGIWHRALSTAEMHQLYIDPSAPFAGYNRKAPFSPLPLTPLTENLVDTIALSDTISVTLSDFIALTVGLSDTIALSDSISNQLPVDFELSDTLVLSDRIDLLLGLIVSPSESLNLVDTLTEQNMSVLDLDIRDFIVFQDFLETSSQTFLALNDTLSLSDVIVISLGITALNFVDSLVLSDAIDVNLSGNIVLNLSDFYTLVDSVSTELRLTFNQYIRRYLNDV